MRSKFFDVLQFLSQFSYQSFNLYGSIEFAVLYIDILNVALTLDTCVNLYLRVKSPLSHVIYD